MDVLVVRPNQPLQVALLTEEYNLRRYGLADDAGKLAVIGKKQINPQMLLVDN